MQKRVIIDVMLALLLGFLKKSEYKRLCTQILIVEKQDVELKGANISLLKNNIETENFILPVNLQPDNFYKSGLIDLTPQV